MVNQHDKRLHTIATCYNVHLLSPLKSHVLEQLGDGGSQASCGSLSSVMSLIISLCLKSKSKSKTEFHIYLPVSTIELCSWMCRSVAVKERAHSYHLSEVNSLYSLVVLTRVGNNSFLSYPCYTTLPVVHFTNQIVNVTLERPWESLNKCVQLQWMSRCKDDF